MAQQWAALISVGPSGTQVPCPVLPPSPFSLAPRCWQVKCTTGARCHTQHGWLAPRGLIPLPWLGSKDRRVHLTFGHGSRAETWQGTAELKYHGYSVCWCDFFCLFIHCPIQNQSDYTHCHFQGPSDVEAVWKASGYSTSTWTCIVQIQTQVTSKCFLHLSKISDIIQ